MPLQTYGSETSPSSASQTGPRFVRKTTAFDADGVTLRGWLYEPSGLDKHPAIVMTGGYGTTKEMFTDDYAAKFANAGFTVLLYDGRNFGGSDGTPRHEIAPWRQVEDFRHAVTHASGLPTVDPHRIGVWGSSYSGGHVIVVGATDRRVKCVVAQVPTISGTRTARRRVTGPAENALLAQFAEDRLKRETGGAPTTVPLMGDDGIYKGKDAVAWYTAGYRRSPGEIPEVTLRSVELARGYNPGDFIAFVSPTPLLMQIAERDYVTPTDLSLEAYRNALEPKSLQILKGSGHFDAYVKDFDRTSAAALQWFETHLKC